ncbi:MAG: hypothetical protein SPJ45_03200 [Anaerovoracaceae bacterium]|nr:hypothetical protein [Bacillota bacterium]MDD7733878.1 hypothetical protein [Bacillota bacterium]MDY5905872.1 hypothetical protein [Anaerovoracaceae bacterium]
MFYKWIAYVTLIISCALLLASCGSDSNKSSTTITEHNAHTLTEYDEGYISGYEDGKQAANEDDYPLYLAVDDLMDEGEYDKVDAIVNALKDDFCMDYIYDGDYILDTRTNTCHSVRCPDIENISSRYIKCIISSSDVGKELIENATMHQCPEPDYPMS